MRARTKQGNPNVIVGCVELPYEYSDVHPMYQAGIEALALDGRVEIEPPPPADSRAAHRTLDPHVPLAVQAPSKIDRKGYPTRRGSRT